ncbi:hypothetical protein V5799_034065 [Amblyomma americanum]|uniref:Ketosynthase family 3 (KS3) domain-containing protein n=1 Tax=Amblyomma americanum TaxID=6943 RepID=A0AAQ4DLI7_AMBAM
MAAAAEDIVVTGFSARFPQADSLAEFKEKLYAGFDFVTDDEIRWPRGHLGLPARMGKIRDLSLFDAEFFGVPPKQAHLMDPQMRFLLETCYEAIVDSGYDPQALRGRRALARLLRDTYSEAGVDPCKVGYVEAHGTGTQVGDSQELLSISNVFCQPQREKPLKVGAVKSNVGHAEPASGKTHLASIARKSIDVQMRCAAILCQAARCF